MITLKLNEFSGFNTMLMHVRAPLENVENSDSKFSLHQKDGYVSKLGKMDTYLVNRAIELGDCPLRYCKITATINAPLYWWMDLLHYSTKCTVSLKPVVPHEVDMTDFSTEHMTSDEHLHLCELTVHLNAEYETWMANSCEDSFHTWHGMLPQCYMQSGVLTISLAELKRLFDARVTSTFNEWCGFFEALDEQGMPLSEYVTGW